MASLALVSFAASGVLAHGFANVSAESGSLHMCPDSSIVDPTSEWLWETTAVPSPSCQSPAVTNPSKQCADDPTSVVLQSHGNTGCFATRMPDCKFSMYDLQQMEFDLRLMECSGTWAAPLWVTPDHWQGGGRSGEIDMVELCPTHSVSSNFAGATAPTGYQVTWDGVSPDSFDGHVTLWKQSNGDVTVKICSAAEASNNGGSCSGDGAAYYPNIYGSYGCSDGQDCMFTFISDIWNGLSGDAGYWGCTGGAPPSTKDCRFSVRNLKVHGPTFSGKCGALSSQSSPRRRSTPRRRRSSSWQPCVSGACCDPTLSPQQICPDGQACQACGAVACQCPGGLAEEITV